MNLLSVDWDFFFPYPEHDPHGYYDWGHQESPFFINDVWTIRAAAFLDRGQDLPVVDQSWKHFWHEFRFTAEATLTYGESHAWAADPRMVADITEVWNYDAHHDCGYGQWATVLPPLLKGGEFNCGNWMIRYILDNVKTHVRYPGWRSFSEDEDSRATLEPTTKAMAFTDEPSDLPVFDYIYVCRSGAWTPPWTDDDFMAFLDACPVPSEQRWDIGKEFGWPTVPRKFDPEQVKRMQLKLDFAMQGNEE